MPKPIRVSFQISNAKELDRALESVERRVERLSRMDARVMRTARAPSQSTSRVAMSAEESHAKRIEAIKARSARMTGKHAEQAARAEIRARERVEREAKRSYSRQAAAASKARARTIAGRAGIISRAGRSTIGSIAGAAGGLGLTAGGFAISNALISTARLKAQAQQMVNASTDSKGNLATTKTGQQLDANYLTGYAQRMGTKYGVDPSQVLGGLGVVSERAGGGEALAGVMESWDDLTKTAVTYGTTMEDLGGVVAAALDAGVKPGKDLNKIVQDFVAMGKLGAIEFGDLASELAKLKGAGISYDMQGGEMLRSMVSLTQIGARAAVTPEESRTALKDIGRDVGMKRKFLEKSGVSTLSNGKNRNAFDLLADIIDKSETEGLYGAGRKGRAKGTPGIEGIFTGTSLNIVKELGEIYRGKDKEKFGSGRSAVMKALKEFAGAELPAGERDKRFGEVMNTELAQAQVAFQKFNVEISKMLPEFMKLLPAVSKTAVAFAEVATFFANNPFIGIGALVGKNLTTEIGAVGLKSIFKSAVEGGLQGGVFNIGNLKAAGAIGIVATTVTLLGMKVIDNAFEQGADKGKEAFRSDIEARNMMAKAGSAENLTVEQRADLTAKASTLKGHAKTLDKGLLQNMVDDFSLFDQLGTVRGAINYSGQSSEGESAAGARETAGMIEQFLGAAKTLTAASGKLDTAASNLESKSRSGAPPGRAR